MYKKSSSFLLSLLGCISALSSNNKPNILICIADDASMWTLGAYGCTFSKTPAIDSIAKQGAIFTNAFTENPKSAPSRALLLTGKHSWQLKEATNHFCHFPNELITYPEILMKNGYYVGYTGKGWKPGTYDRPNNPAGPEFSNKKNKAPYTGISNIDYASNFNDFLDQNGDNSPFCFWLGSKEPHRPYELDSWKKANLDISKVNLQPFFPNRDVIKGDMLDYVLEVEWFDKHVGNAFRILKDKGLLDNTLIIITSDHGMPFPRVKGQIYEEAFHIPFIVYWKGKIKAGTKIEDFIGFQDVAPTLLEISGIRKNNQMTGKSFYDVLKNQESGQVDKKRDHIILCKERHDVGRANDEGVDLGYPVRAIRTNDYLYIKNYKPDRWPVGNPEYGYCNCDGSPTKRYLTNLLPNDKDYVYFTLAFGKRPDDELYDIRNDKYCLHNLAYFESYKKIKNKLLKRMESELKAEGDPRMFGKGDVFDHYKYVGRPCKYKK